MTITPEQVAKYEELERKFGVEARRAAEAADTATAMVEEDERNFLAAYALAAGSAYRPGVVSGR